MSAPDNTWLYIIAILLTNFRDHLCMIKVKKIKECGCDRLFCCNKHSLTTATRPLPIERVEFDVGNFRLATVTYHLPIHKHITILL